MFDIILLRCKSCAQLKELEKFENHGLETPLQKKNLTAKGSDDKRALLVSYADLITM